MNPITKGILIEIALTLLSWVVVVCAIWKIIELIWMGIQFIKH